MDESAFIRSASTPVQQRPSASAKPITQWEAKSIAETSGTLKNFYHWTQSPTLASAKHERFQPPKEFPKNLPQGERYPKWISWLQNFTTAVRLTENKTPEKISDWLYTSAGNEIRQLIEAKDLNSHYCGVELCDAITDIFRAAANPATEYQELRHIAQRPGESPRDFAIRLKLKAQICGVANLSPMILDLLRSGMTNREIARQSRIHLWDEETTVSAAERDMSEGISSSPFSDRQTPIPVQQIKHAPPPAGAREPRENRKRKFKELSSDTRSPRTKACNGCGGPCNSRKECPMQGKECRKCGKQNHSAKVCRSGAARIQTLTPSSEKVKTDVESFEP